MWDVTLCHTKLRLMVTRDIVITGHQLTCARGLTSSQWFRTIDNFPGMWSSSAWPGPQLRYYPLNIKCLITQEARVWSDGCVGLEGRGVTGHHLAMCARGGPQTLLEILYPGEITECRMGVWLWGLELRFWVKFISCDIKSFHHLKCSCDDDSYVECRICTVRFWRFQCRAESRKDLAFYWPMTSGKTQIS